MTHNKFAELIKELDEIGSLTLIQKNQKYSSENNALLNFQNGADIYGGTLAQTCWAYLTKHLAALRKMVQENNFADREDFLEKCQDSINYIRFLWAIGNETSDYKNIKSINECEEDCQGCNACKNYYICLTSYDGAEEQCTEEPCKSCKCNFVYGTKECKEAPFNYEPKEN